MKIYHGNSESRELVSEVQTIKEAFSFIAGHIKTKHKYLAPYYRQWMQDGERVIDYGSHRNFYYIVFEEVE
ncbi:hypothetical protein [Streptococcus fryi]